MGRAGQGRVARFPLSRWMMLGWWGWNPLQGGRGNYKGRQVQFRLMMTYARHDYILISIQRSCLGNGAHLESCCFQHDFQFGDSCSVVRSVH